MTKQGDGVMLSKKDIVEKSIGKEILRIVFSEDELKLFFSNNGGLKIWDGGQSCCEHRYMTTDDDLDYLVGSRLLEIEVTGEKLIKEEEGDYHEVQFLIIKTDRGAVTIETHNENNGYYGGFCLEAEAIDAL